MHVKTEMKSKVGKETVGGSKKRKGVGNESPLTSMFQKQHTFIDLNKSRETYNVLLQKVLGLDEAAHAEPVYRSENNTHPIVESDTVDATVDATVTRRSWTPTGCQNLSIWKLLVRRVFMTC